MEPTSVMETDCRAVSEKLNAGARFLLLDCREQHEYDTVHIDGAFLLPMSEIQQRVAELDSHRDSEVIVYCHHGVRSLNVAAWLREQGFVNVSSMAGGIDAWALDVDTSLPRY